MRVVLSAYACDPEQGSESGAGWAVLQAASRLATHVTLITRAGNAPTLESSILELPCEIDIVRIETPFDFSRSTYFRYCSWLIKATRVIRDKSVEADVIHHATFASDWMPPPFSRVAMRRCRAVWGPVGGNTYPPLAAMTGFGASFLAKEFLRTTTTRIIRLITRAYLDRCVRAFISLNTDSIRSAPRGAAVSVHPNCILDYSHLVAYEASRVKNRGKLLFVGRLHEWKGVLLAMAAFQNLDNSWELTIIGDGPARSEVEAKAARTPRVNVIGSCSRAEVAQQMSESDVVIFPSLHDSAGWVAAEAAAIGLPVVCLDLGGVATMAGENAVIVRASPVSSLPQRLARAVLAASAGEYSPQTNWTIGSMTDCLESAYSPISFSARSQSDK
jgi:glycosyltransferase involved in cell wall biosynthesis